MKITIDGNIVEIFPEDKNIVDVSDRIKRPIPAPCYKNNRAKGCCSGCVIEVNGQQGYACTTKPVEGMNIVVEREDLKQIRKQRLLIYAQNIKNNIKGVCDCGCDCGSGDGSGCC